MCVQVCVACVDVCERAYMCVCVWHLSVYVCGVCVSGVCVCVYSLKRDVFVTSVCVCRHSGLSPITGSKRKQEVGAS